MPEPEDLSALIESIDPTDRWELEGAARILALPGLSDADRAQRIWSMRQIGKPPPRRTPMPPDTRPRPSRLRDRVLYFMARAGIQNRADLCRAAGLPESMATQLLPGYSKRRVRPDADTVRKVADVLGVPAETLAILILAEK